MKLYIQYYAFSLKNQIYTLKSGSSEGISTNVYLQRSETNPPATF